MERKKLKQQNCTEKQEAFCDVSQHFFLVVMAVVAISIGEVVLPLLEYAQISVMYNDSSQRVPPAKAVGA